MKRMRGMLAVAVLTAALAGCAGADSTGRTDGGSALPKGEELAAWADGAIPENQTGGADYVVRATGSVAPGAQVGIDISALSGPGTLSIACMTATGARSLQVEAPGDSGTETVVCATPDDPASGTTTIVPISDVATLTVTADSVAVFVYAVSPPGAEPAR